MAAAAGGAHAVRRRLAVPLSAARGVRACRSRYLNGRARGRPPLPATACPLPTRRKRRACSLRSAFCSTRTSPRRWARAHWRRGCRRCDQMCTCLDTYVRGRGVAEAALDVRLLLARSRVLPPLLRTPDALCLGRAPPRHALHPAPPLLANGAPAPPAHRRVPIRLCRRGGRPSGCTLAAAARVRDAAAGGGGAPSATQQHGGGAR